MSTLSNGKGYYTHEHYQQNSAIIYPKYWSFNHTCIWVYKQGSY